MVGFCDPRDPGAAEFRRFVPDISPSGMWPVVRFAADQSERIIGPDSWAIEDGGVEVAKRSQVPLILAWALSVHKCQGMTLDRVETDLSRAFDFGMVYVALSRVRSLEGLNLKAFDPSKIKVYFYIRVELYFPFTLLGLFLNFLLFFYRFIQKWGIFISNLETLECECRINQLTN